MKQKAERINLERISVKLIDPSPFGIRKEMRLGELAGSMRKGVLSPIKIRPAKGGRFEVVYGDRRLQQSKRLGFKEINAIVEPVTDREGLIQHVTENCARKDFNPIEEANAFRRLKREASFKTQDVAKLVGKSPGHVSNRLALLRLPLSVQEHVVHGTIGSALATRIAQTIPPKMQEDAVQTIITRKLDHWKANAYVESLEQSFKASRLFADQKAVQGKPIRGFSAKRFQAKPASKRELEDVRNQTEMKLQEAFGVGSVDVSSLEFWRLLLATESKLVNYKPRVKEEALIDALERDLESLRHSPVNVGPQEVRPTVIQKTPVRTQLG